MKRKYMKTLFFFMIVRSRLISYQVPAIEPKAFDANIFIEFYLSA